MSTCGEHIKQPTRKRPLMETDKPETILCTVVAMDHKNLCYRVCSVCEKTLPENSAASCRHCNFTNSFNPSTSGFKRLFRVLVSIATDRKVMVVIMFDRAARVLFGCSADDLFHFAKTHPYAASEVGLISPAIYDSIYLDAFLAATTVSKALEGEMLSVTLSKPKNGNAQHLRVVSVVPMRSGFQPAIHTLRDLYPVRGLS